MGKAVESRLCQRMFSRVHPNKREGLQGGLFHTSAEQGFERRSDCPQKSFAKEASPERKRISSAEMADLRSNGHLPDICAGMKTNLIL